MSPLRIGLGVRIREQRQQRGWSQEHLARLVGVSKSFLSDVENGKGGVIAETLLSLAQALEVSMDFLMTGVGPATYGGTDAEHRRLLEENAELRAWQRTVREWYNAAHELVGRSEPE